MSSTALTLYDIEEGLQALLDTAEIVPADQQAAFELELAEQLRTAVDKRERCGQFMRSCNLGIENRKAEVTRLNQGICTLERAIERMEGIVLRVIEGLGTDAKGKYRKLEGHTVTFAAKRTPGHVEITNDDKVPVEYKSAEVKLPMLMWRDIMDVFFAHAGEDQKAEVVRHLGEKTRTDTVSRTAVKKAIEGGAEVPGAELTLGGLRLEVK